MPESHRSSKQFVSFILVVQAILWLAHFFLYETWTFSPESSSVSSPIGLRLAFGALSLSFVIASLLAFRHHDAAVRALYKLAAVWAGLLSFLLFGAAASWILFGIGHLCGIAVNFHRLVEILFVVALMAGAYGVFNASWTRVTKISVRLANLPVTWRGRTAALVSDLHLGHVRNGSFLRRIVRKILKHEPDAIFIAGDLYDGTAIDAQLAATPLQQLVAPQGVYFVAGNHEQFGSDSKYLDAVAAAGVRVLSNEKAEVDGLQILGVPTEMLCTGIGLLRSCTPWVWIGIAPASC